MMRGIMLEAAAAGLLAVPASSSAHESATMKWILDPEGMREKTNAPRTPAMKLTKQTAQQVDALVAYITSLKPVKAAAEK